jgi:hypothetical protein
MVGTSLLVSPMELGVMVFGDIGEELDHPRKSFE